MSLPSPFTEIVGDDDLVVERSAQWNYHLI